MRHRWHITAAHSPGITSSLEQKKGFFSCVFSSPSQDVGGICTCQVSWAGLSHSSHIQIHTML